MKKRIKVFLLICLMTSLMNKSVGAEYWEKVADKGFGNPANDYAWSMATFQGKLYVGTLNSVTGAQIWSSSSGEAGTWKKVFQTRSPFNFGIRCLYSDRDEALYACTFNFLGTEILRSYDGERWITVLRGGLGGNRDNYTARCMVRFGEYLYAGTGNKGAELYRSKNGVNWKLVKAEPDFQSTKVRDKLTHMSFTNNLLIGELAVFNEQLYAFTWTADLNIKNLPGLEVNLSDSSDSSLSELDELKVIDFSAPSTPGAFEVWRSRNGIQWEKVVGQDDPYGNGMGFSLYDSANLANDAVTSVAVFKGRLYLGTENAASNPTIWRTREGTKWEKVLDFFDLGERSNLYVWRMIAFQDRLFIGTFNMGPKSMPGVTGAQIWASASGAAGSFYNLVYNGFDGETIPMMSIEIPKNYGIRAFGILNNTLFAGTATMLSLPAPDLRLDGAFIAGKDSGCEIWKLIQ